ncbi:hypothetical protein FSP39_007121 [Pinctada imbricata]|uniref:Uncharacterized protein n=1 Tax=Pinctada imbricata TaxID=66713 RepID=A0AA88Y2L3_PINIB|nr:hypothetical protein FSP39_007121 [Pinctada imbricata]
MSKDDLIARYIEDSELRRQTFARGWPVTKSYLSLDEFIRQGFYFTGEADKVQCVYCKGYLKSWELNDDILLEHRKHFPQCPFIRQPYKFPDFRDYQERFQSCSDWPTQLTQKPEDLAKAGLFYMGKGDQTQCFWCGGILMDWDPWDIPILEHAKHFKQCPWLEVIKDSKFFKEAKMVYILVKMIPCFYC